MNVQRFDPYALTSYSFAVRKTNNYFSCGTVLLTILILVSSFLINLKTIEHLWINRSQLPILSKRSIQYPETITQSYICFDSTAPISARKKDMTILQLQSVPLETIKKQYPSMHSAIGPQGSCFSLKNQNFSSEFNTIFFEIAAPPGPGVSMYVSGITENSILQGTPTNFFKATSQISTILCRKLSVPFLTVTFQDKLYMNYSPQKITAVKFIPDYTITTLIGISGYTYTTSNTSAFAFQLYTPLKSYPLKPDLTFNSYSILITRNNIVTIIGSFLAWVSILSLIALVVGPFMEKALTLVLAQTLFYIQPIFQSPSLIKYSVSCLKSGIFQKEDRFVILCERLNSMMDISFILKLQRMLLNVVPKGRIENAQLIASQHNFQQPVQTCPGVHHFQQNSGLSLQAVDGSDDQQHISLLTKIRRAALYFFDQGSDNISVRYTQNIGSVKSFVLTLIFCLGTLAFFVIFGAFNMGTQIKKYNVISQQPIQITFQPSELFFVANTGFSLRILDGNYVLLDTVLLESNEDCFRKMPVSKVSTMRALNRTIFCLAKPTSINFNQKQPTQTRIIKLDTLGVTQQTTMYFFKSAVNAKTDVIEHIIGLWTISSAVQEIYHTVLVQKIIQFTDDNTLEHKQVYPVSVSLNNRLIKVVGTLLTAASFVSQYHQQRAQIFQMVENIWTFAIICFSVVLVKITKYINLSHKQKKISPQKAEFRDSLCVLLSKINGLKNGRFKSQLQAQKYYIKEEMPRY